MFDDYAANVKSSAAQENENEYSVLVIQQQPVQFGAPEQPRCTIRKRLALAVACILLAAAGGIVWWLLSGRTTSSSSPNSFPLPPISPQCTTPFGTQLGLPTSTGTPAFSNCYQEFQSMEANLVPTQQLQAVQTGYKWQSVEYASRSLVALQQVVIPAVQSPAAVWPMSNLPSVSGASSSQFVSYLNGNSFSTNGNTKPAIGDVIVYPAQSGLPQGHVAVVVGVKGEYAFIAEQNWQNTPWTHVEYSRALQLSVVTPGGGSSASGSVTINEAGSSGSALPVEYGFQMTDPEGYQIYGWKRVVSA